MWSDRSKKKKLLEEVDSYLDNYKKLPSLSQIGPRIDPWGTPHVTFSEFYNWSKDISTLQVDHNSDQIWAREADPLIWPVTVPVLIWETKWETMQKVTLHGKVIELIFIYDLVQLWAAFLFCFFPKKLSMLKFVKWFQCMLN